MWFGVIGKTELVEDAQLIVIFEYSCGLAWASQCLLLLDIIGKLAERLPYRSVLRFL